MALERSQEELQLWFRPHSDWRSELGDMSVQSLGSSTWDSFGTPPWESREKVSFGCGSRGVTQSEPLAGREAAAPSIIRIVQIVQRGEEMHPNGGIVLLENVQV